MLKKVGYALDDFFEILNSPTRIKGHADKNQFSCEKSRKPGSTIMDEVEVLEKDCKAETQFKEESETNKAETKINDADLHKRYTESKLKRFSEFFGGQNGKISPEKTQIPKKVIFSYQNDTKTDQNVTKTQKNDSKRDNKERVIEESLEKVSSTIEKFVSRIKLGNKESPQITPKVDMNQKLKKTGFISTTSLMKRGLKIGPNDRASLEAIESEIERLQAKKRVIFRRVWAQNGHEKNNFSEERNENIQNSSDSESKDILSYKSKIAKSAQNLIENSKLRRSEQSLILKTVNRMWKDEISPQDADQIVRETMEKVAATRLSKRNIFRGDCSVRNGNFTDKGNFLPKDSGSDEENSSSYYVLSSSDENSSSCESSYSSHLDDEDSGYVEEEINDCDEIQIKKGKKSFEENTLNETFQDEKKSNYSNLIENFSDEFCQTTKFTKQYDERTEEFGDFPRDLRENMDFGMKNEINPYKDTPGYISEPSGMEDELGVEDKDRMRVDVRVFGRMLRQEIDKSAIFKDPGENGEVSPVKLDTERSCNRCTFKYAAAKLRCPICLAPANYVEPKLWRCQQCGFDKNDYFMKECTNCNYRLKEESVDN